MITESRHLDPNKLGGANDESNWRGIMEYFAPAVQLGLTATPKRSDNVDTYAYFGDPVYVYSLKEGINDGFLTPFKVKQISTTLDEYIYTPDDTLVEGDIEVQTRRTLDNLLSVLDPPGATLANVVNMRVILRDVADFPRFNEVFRSYFENDRVTRTCVGGTPHRKGVNVEIDCVAMFD